MLASNTAPLLVLLVLSAPPARAAPQDSAEEARRLFVANCATCHGETGDGQGVTQLDRPARSFKDGGFSFGNTAETLFRTISTGIPGTPMPGFDSSLSVEERELLANYVVTLGPPVEAVDSEDMVLVVRERPLIVRGLLPSLGEGLPSHPRGLLIGDPSGITFEYRVDDVRLLALRQGGFVRRSDWTGRGGSALEPLGKVVHLVQSGRPGACFHAPDGPLSARLSGTRVGRQAMVEYRLLDGARELAHVQETPSVVSTAFGTGYERRFRFQGLSDSIQLRTPAFPGGRLVANGTWDPKGKPKERYFVVRPAEGPPVYIGVSPALEVRRISEAPLQFGGDLAGKADGPVEERVLTVLVLTNFDGDTTSKLEQWREGRQ